MIGMACKCVSIVRFSGVPEFCVEEVCTLEGVMVHLQPLHGGPLAKQLKHLKPVRRLRLSISDMVPGKQSDSGHTEIG